MLVCNNRLSTTREGWGAKQRQAMQLLRIQVHHLLHVSTRRGGRVCGCSQIRAIAHRDRIEIARTECLGECGAMWMVPGARLTSTYPKSMHPSCVSCTKSEGERRRTQLRRATRTQLRRAMRSSEGRANRQRRRPSRTKSCTRARTIIDLSCE
eukprot:2666442-Pleurochrysis_carterae.AAC.1